MRFKNIIQANNGQLIFAQSWSPVLRWCLVLPSAIIAYAFVKLLFFILVTLVLKTLGVVSPTLGFWFALSLGSIVGAFICWYAFVYIGAAMAPDKNQLVATFLTILVLLLFVVALINQPKTISSAYNAMYLFSILGALVALWRRCRRYA